MQIFVNGDPPVYRPFPVHHPGSQPPDKAYL